ncbi:MAG: hypothetical protein Q4G67_12830, partial [Actinomycetia bacterium]|nr:hypothetical protein [Actinomycetes bacterium]
MGDDDQTRDRGEFFDSDSSFDSDADSTAGPSEAATKQFNSEGRPPELSPEDSHEPGQGSSFGEDHGQGQQFGQGQEYDQQYGQGQQWGQ